VIKISQRNLQNLMGLHSVEPELAVMINSMGQSIQHTQTLFLSPDGDDSDGSSWSRAYTTLAAVQVAANDDVNSFTAVMCAKGTYDVDVSGSFTFTKQLHLFGITRSNTIFQNTHTSATGVFTLNAFCMFQNIQVSCGTGNFGILFESTADGSRMYNCYINGLSATGAVNLIEVDGGANNRFEDIYIIGNPASILTTAIEINTASFAATFVNATVAYAAVGINLDNTINQFCIFTAVEVINCTAGINIEAANTINVFRHVNITGTTTPINDEGSLTNWNHDIVSDSLHAHLIPDDLTGIQITAAAGAGNWTAVEVELYAAVAATEPYIITGIVFEADTLEKYELRLSADGGTTYFWTGIVEAAADRSQRIEFLPKHIRQGTQIVGSIRSETGGNDMLVWLKILQY